MLVKSKILRLIVPVTGCISYEAFSFSIMNPTKFKQMFGYQSSTVADVLWLNAHIGLGVYIFHQDFLHAASPTWKITYSVFGAALFNFGSVLMWGTSKTLLPNVPEGIKVLFGLGSGLALLYIGWNFTDFLNMEVGRKRAQ